MRVNTTWKSVCTHCGTSLTNNGSGRPKSICKSCRLKQMRIYQKNHYVPKPLYQPDRRISNRQILNTIKLEIGECQLHQSFNNGERKFVLPGLEYLFDMDHIDRHTKDHTVSKLMKCSEQVFRSEVAKCQLVCMECHRRKTVENKDWKSITKALKPLMTKVYIQLTLFDN